MISGDLIIGWIVFWHFLEHGARADESDRVCAVDLSPPIVRGLDDLRVFAISTAREPGLLATLVLSLTVEKIDSIGFDV
jgi:hypothetical protein